MQLKKYEKEDATAQQQENPGSIRTKIPRFALHFRTCSCINTNHHIYEQPRQSK